MNPVEQLERRRLETRVKELERQLAEIVSAKYGTAVHTLAMLRDEYASKLVAAEHRQTEELERLVTELAEAGVAKERLRAQLAQMEKQQVRLHTAAERQREQFSSEMEEVRGLVEALKQKLGEESERAQEAEERAEQSQKVAEEQTGHMQVLLATVEGFEGKEGVEQRLLDLSAELCSSKAIAAASDRKLAELTSQLAAKQREISMLAERLKDEQKAREEARAGRRQTEREIQHCQAAGKQLEERVAASEAESKELRFTADRLSREKALLEEKLERAEQRRSEELRAKEKQIESERKAARERAEQVAQEALPQGRALLTHVQQLLAGILASGVEQQKDWIQELGHVLIEQDKVVAALERRLLVEKLSGAQEPPAARIGLLEAAVKENEQLRAALRRATSWEMLEERRAAE